MAERDSHPPLGRLPRLTNPQRYQGLYIIDFGDGISVGYLPAEVTTLAESNQFPHMHVYRIHRAQADGTLEIVSVPLQKFTGRSEESILFLRERETEAREDFETLKSQATGRFPCRARMELVEVPDADWPCATILIYPAEYTDEVGRWLLEANYRGGDSIEMGIHNLAAIRQAGAKVLDETMIDAAKTGTPRTMEELLAARRYAVQR